MKEITWCREEVAEGCRRDGDHVHVVITSVGSRRIIPACRKTTIRMFFYDLDPDAIRRTNAYAENPDKGKELVDGCFTQEHARQLVWFLNTVPEEADVVVNCEAGVSRSPAIVLALRRKYGGDTEDVFRRACPNIHVASVLGRELGVGPFEPRKYEDIVNPFPDEKEDPRTKG